MLTQRKDRCVLQLAKTIQGILEAFINTAVDGEEFHCQECFASSALGTCSAPCSDVNSRLFACGISSRI